MIPTAPRTSVPRRCARLLLALLALLAAAATAVPAAAQAQELPTAEQILERFRQASGGAAGFRERTSIRTVGEVSMPAAGITGAYEAFSVRPNRAATRTVIEGIGEILTGYTGQVGWTVSPLEGPRLLQGSENDQAGDESNFSALLRLAESFDSATVVERTTLGGTECFKVRMVWKSGRDSLDCYSPETGLLVGTVTRTHTPAGVTDAVTLYDDYREFGGLRLPTLITVQALGAEQVIRLFHVDFDDVPESAVEPPPAVRALIGG
jgi:hypothetical protein